MHTIQHTLKNESKLPRNNIWHIARRTGWRGWRTWDDVTVLMTVDVQRLAPHSVLEPTQLSQQLRLNLTPKIVKIPLNVSM